jgi:hypothetical protein
MTGYTFKSVGRPIENGIVDHLKDVESQAAIWISSVVPADAT